MRLITSILLVLIPILGMAQNQEPVFVEKVVNSIQIGPLTDNKNLAFGVKNILQELVQENHPLMETIDENTIVLKTEIVFFDILTTKTNISVFHSDETEVVIRIKGTLYKNGKKIKQFLAEESSSERTEEPTARRMQKAREDGQVARSVELPTGPPRA